jgi:hypothetical protein
MADPNPASGDDDRQARRALRALGLVDELAQTEAELLEAGLEVGHLSDEPHGLLTRERGGGAGVEHGQTAPQVLELVRLHAGGA